MERQPLAACPRCGGKLQPGAERRRQTKAGFATRKEARAAMNKVLAAVAERSYVAPTKVTLEQFLTDEWLPAIESTVRLTTYRSYVQHVKWHIAPHLGEVALSSLSGAQINGLYATLASHGRKGGKAGLSPQTVRHVHAVLHRALRDAVRWGLIGRNPIDSADPPRPASSREMHTWNPKQLEAFLDFTANDRLHAMWQLLALTGMRRGEACGLRWCDCDLEQGRIAVAAPWYRWPAPCSSPNPRRRAAGARSPSMRRRWRSYGRTPSARPPSASPPRAGPRQGLSLSVRTDRRCRPTR